MDNTKPPYLSKTIILNSIGFILMALLPFVPGLAPVQTWIQGNLALVGTIWTAIGIGLRFITKDKIILVE